MKTREILATFAAAWLAVQAVPAAGADRAGDTAARRLAAAIEERAEKTSFAELEHFGAEAAKSSGREALRRLHHVAQVMLNQSEFDKFQHWNGLLHQKALGQIDHRYLVISQVDELKSQYDRGKSGMKAEIARIGRSDPDWFVRVHAMTVEAFMLIEEKQVGAALKLLFKATDMIHASDRDAAAAESEVWEAMGLALMQLNDLEGSAKALQKADIELADKAYPRPDFDAVYNMAHLAVLLGDGALARDLTAAHNRLVASSDLPHLDAWDRNLCAMVAESFATPRDVAACFVGLDAKLTGAEFLAPRILPMRAIASARRGELAAARGDLSLMRRLKASHEFSDAAFRRESQVAAEILAAEGRDREAFAMLRAYSLQQAQEQAQRFSAGVRQLTDELERQLESLKHEAALESDVVRTQRWLGLLAALLVIGAGAVLVWQRRVAFRLRAEQRKAEQASRAKSEFLANMSHEIRTPLNGVVGVADMLASAGLPERERGMAEVIRSSGQTLERLLSDVLDLARVEAGQLIIENAPFHAGELVRSVAALSKLRAEEKGLALEVEIMPQLEGWFIGDAVRVRQILTNFVSNAVKFTERGKVSIRAEQNGLGRLCFRVSDTGVGFDAAQKERLFGRFQQADGSITRRFGGTGLGLAISRQLASLMGGVVDADGRCGDGARFWFEAPFAPADAPQEDAAAEEAGGPSSQRILRVLVADDHATNQTVVRMMLEQFGHEVVLVEDGAQALAACRRERFDVVLMDMQMPVMDGLEAVRRIREHEQAASLARTPILMLSANALAEHREAGRRAGADGHISKPVTVAGLMSGLHAALEDDEAQEPAQAALA